jgi:hypothetical protein
MGNPPLTPDEKAAADATRDIMFNVTDGRNWHDYDEKYVRDRIMRAIRDAAKATAIAVCLAHPAYAGTVTCAGKTYKDINYATMMPSGYFAIVKLWTVAVHEYGEGAKFSVIMNTETLCEFEDVPLRVLIENGPE